MDQRPVRGSRMVLAVPRSAGASQLVQAATQKFAAHDRNFDSSGGWNLRYPDGSEVHNLPESHEPFELAKYKDQLLKDFQRIVLYLAPGTESCSN